MCLCPIHNASQADKRGIPNALRDIVINLAAEEAVLAHGKASSKKLEITA
jgi:hypothetical protein